MKFLDTADYRTLHKIHDALRHSKKTPALQNYLNCMHVVREQGVSIIKQNNRVFFHGLRKCRNGWICPVCAPAKLAKAKRLVTAAFQKFNEEGYKCCMTTFTIPHKHANFESGCNYRKDISLSTMFYILKRAYSKFWSYRGLQKLRANAKTFIIHEITYSERYGWHPHIHALHWFKPEDFDKYTAYEETMDKFWKHTLSVVYKEITWNTTEQESLTDSLNFAINSASRPAIFISKDGNNQPRNINQTNYFWGGVNETTDLTYKKAKKGNLTQWQILEKVTSDNDPDGKYLKLVKEIIESVRSLSLYRFKPGLVQELQEYLKTHPIILQTKKKLQYDPGTKPQIVCWLSQRQWNLLKYREHIKYLNLILSSFAIQDNAFELIKEFCTVFKVDEPLQKPPFKLKFQDLNVA